MKEKKFLVDKEAKQINMFDQRWYKIQHEGTEHNLRSVTTFLEAYPDNYNLYQWFKANGFNSDILLERAQQFGSAFHGLIETLLKGGRVEWNEEMDIRLWERLMLWVDYWKELNENHEVKYSPDYVEMITYDLKYEYAGTVDLVCRIDGELVIMDWKTSNYPKANWHLQTAAYAKSLEKNLNAEISKAMVVWFPEKKPNKKGYRIIDNPDIELNFNKFLNVKDVYLLEHENETPKYKTYPTEMSL